MSQNEEKEFITLEFDDGEEVEYEVEGVIELDEQDYVVLIPTKDKESIEIFRLKETENGEEEEITPIEDEVEYQKVIDELKKCGYQIETE